MVCQGKNLGHIVSANGISTDEEKIKVIVAAKTKDAAADDKGSSKAKQRGDKEDKRRVEEKKKKGTGNAKPQKFHFVSRLAPLFCNLEFLRRSL